MITASQIPNRITAPTTFRDGELSFAWERFKAQRRVVRAEAETERITRKPQEPTR